MNGSSPQSLLLRLLALFLLLIFICLLPLPSLTAAAVLLTIILIIIIGALATLGFFHYRKTGSLLPSLPKLSRSVSLGGILILEVCVICNHVNNLVFLLS